MFLPKIQDETTFENVVGVEYARGIFYVSLLPRGCTSDKRKFIKRTKMKKNIMEIWLNVQNLVKL